MVQSTTKQSAAGLSMKESTGRRWARFFKSLIERRIVLIKIKKSFKLQNKFYFYCIYIRLVFTRLV